MRRAYIQASIMKVQEARVRRGAMRGWAGVVVRRGCMVVVGVESGLVWRLGLEWMGWVSRRWMDWATYSCYVVAWGEDWCYWASSRHWSCGAGTPPSAPSILPTEGCNHCLRSGGYELDIAVVVEVVKGEIRAWQTLQHLGITGKNVGWTG